MRPRIGVTLGDPAGIGYEVVAKALTHGEVRSRADLVLIGNMAQFRRVLSILNIKESILDGVKFYDIPGEPVEFGKVQREAGRISLESVKAGVELAMRGEVDALVTAPISKEAWVLAGSSQIDHTTLLQELTRSRRSITIFEARRLRIYFLTRHIPLRRVADEVRRDRVLEGIVEADLVLKALGVRARRGIAVAALNPHAGEGGLLGREEIDEIKPAIEEARARGIMVYGPFPADSIFYLAARGAYDIVVSLYHDQGHIAAKMYDFRRTVSLTLGLPFLRTSVDHGTAFDIAGTGKADETSMVEAIKKAVRYSLRYRANYPKYFQWAIN